MSNPINQTKGAAEAAPSPIQRVTVHEWNRNNHRGRRSRSGEVIGFNSDVTISDVSVMFTDEAGKTLAVVMNPEAAKKFASIVNEQIKETRKRQL